ncbi:uncharacterized protein [Physcomitrium patens]|uniref:NADP-dependent oxidoreductase domain-containing protein n=1 Tax=Physcomitrium patens TaxID=3218 RepID=A0A2K1JQA4_PHYPA|nr:uncharacterized protein LOC112289322 [Physcomitrium patens]PNR43725.1 hypothetical protein PHYPA_016107 [Physcomitrium patens]|eukprot:XP_024390226.1 uncharacterized protein LOC112289322 [Physcomitrella patens]
MALSWSRSSAVGCGLVPVVRAGNVRSEKRCVRGVQVRAAVASASKIADTMRYNKLGDSDLLISEITLGTMTWGNQNTEKEAHEQLCYAFDNGINIFDSAEVYPIPMTPETTGRTDKFISTWLKTMPRDKVIVATKVAGYSENRTYIRDNGKTVRVDEENITESVDKSLKRLGTDHIDLLQIHWPDRYVPLFGEKYFDPQNMREAVPIVEQLEALKKVIDQGKVRYVGVSNESSWGVMEFTRVAEQLNLPKIVSIQNSYSLLVRTMFEVDLVEVCHPDNCNVGLLAYSPLGGGALTGKYTNPENTTGRFNIFPGYMARYNKGLAREAVGLYVELAKKHNLSPVELALGFCRDRPFVTSSIIGATSLEQLKENMDAFAVTRPLPDEVKAGIDEIFKRYRDPAFI